MFLARILRLVVSLSIMIFSCSNARPSDANLTKAPVIDIFRLKGEWHVPARIPTIIDRGSRDMRIEFKPASARSMKVAWKFRNGDDSSKESAWNLNVGLNSPADTTTWDISPIWPISFKYQVIEYSGDYSWVVIGSSDRRYMWILSRDPELPAELLDGLLARLRSSEFDIAAIVKQEAKSRN